MARFELQGDACRRLSKNARRRLPAASHTSLGGLKTSAMPTERSALAPDLGLALLLCTHYSRGGNGGSRIGGGSSGFGSFGFGSPIGGGPPGGGSFLLGRDRSSMGDLSPEITDSRPPAIDEFGLACALQALDNSALASP